MTKRDRHYHGPNWGSDKQRYIDEEVLDAIKAEIHEEKCIKPAKKEAGFCSCGGKYVLRQNHKNKEYFYGCNNYPVCKKTKN